MESLLSKKGFQQTFFGFQTCAINLSFISQIQKKLACTENVFSEAETLNYRVPEGSLIEQLLFPSFTNDLL